MFHGRTALALTLTAIALLAASSAEADPGNGRAFEPGSHGCSHAPAPAQDAPPRRNCDASTDEPADDPVEEEPPAVEPELATDLDGDVVLDEPTVAPDYVQILGHADRWVSRCRVPRLIGKKRSAARRALRRAGCRVGKTRGRRWHGRVRRQSARAGSLHRHGFRVRLLFR